MFSIASLFLIEFSVIDFFMSWEVVSSDLVTGSNVFFSYPHENFVYRAYLEILLLLLGFLTKPTLLKVLNHQHF